MNKKAVNEKYLEFIQANIARMGQNSFHMKGWAITLIAALLALFVSSSTESTSGNSLYIYIAIMTTFVFWLLDSFYLQQERKFRGIYIDAANLSNERSRIELRPFEMPLEKYKGGKYSFVYALFSKTICPLYVAIIATLVAMRFLLTISF
jgi:hypothetical protein